MTHFGFLTLDTLEPWEAREIGRFLDGTYKAPYWTRDWNYAPIFAPLWRDFAHVCKSEPALIAYTQNAEKGRADIQTPIKPGKYLTKRFVSYMHPWQKSRGCSEREMPTVESYAQWIAGLATTHCASAAPIDLRFAATPEDIQRVYAEGPGSCMKAKDSVRVYGAGDLAVAYVQSEAGITARALCWPEKRIYGRVYGDTVRLSSALASAGYYGEGAQSQWNGARLLRIPVGPAASAEAFVCPCVDMANTVYDDGEYLRLGAAANQRASWACHSQEGFVGRVARCASCNHRFTGEEEPVWSALAEANYCERCYDENVERCAACEDEIWRNEAINLRNDAYCLACANECSFRCERCSERALNEDAVEVDGCDECPDCAESARQCCACDERSHGEMVETSEAEPRVFCPRCAEDEAFRCDDCEGIYLTADLPDTDVPICVACAAARLARGLTPEISMPLRAAGLDAIHARKVERRVRPKVAYPWGPTQEYYVNRPDCRCAKCLPQTTERDERGKSRQRTGIWPAPARCVMERKSEEARRTLGCKWNGHRWVMPDSVGAYCGRA